MLIVPQDSTLSHLAHLTEHQEGALEIKREAEKRDTLHQNEPRLSEASLTSLSSAGHGGSCR